MAGKKEKVKTFKLDEDLGKQINVLAKKSGRTIAAQIRELVRLGIEKEKEEGEKESEKPPYPPEDLETLIDRKIEEKFAHYTNAKDGRLAGEPPNGPGSKRQRTG